MSQQPRWPFAGNADELYERYLVPAMFGPWAEDLVALADRSLVILSSTWPAGVGLSPVLSLDAWAHPAPWSA